MRYVKVVLIFLLYLVPSSAEIQLFNSTNSILSKPAKLSGLFKFIDSSENSQSSDACGIGSNGSACDDGSVCTINDLCFNGVCTGLALDCDDGQVCTIDLCDSVLGCFYTPQVNGTSCGTGLTCQEGACVYVVFENGFE